MHKLTLLCRRGAATTNKMLGCDGQATAQGPEKPKRSVKPARPLAKSTQPRKMASMKIYTRGGDQGTTGLPGGIRVPKGDLRMVATGTLDELNAVLGLVRAEGTGEPMDRLLQQLQNQLFAFGAELATSGSGKIESLHLQESDVEALEHAIDTLEKDLPPLTEFILPGGTKSAALLHLARCVCRRAEREIVAMSAEHTVREVLLKYINRTSDLLFVAARSANATQGRADVPWEKR